MSIDITLSPAELACARTVAAIRHYSSTLRGARDRHGLATTVTDDCHFAGACAEMAAARALGIYWGASVNTYKGADLEPNWQVRGRSKMHYELIVRPDDGDKYRYVLVVGVAPRLTVVGWMWGHEAKREEWLKGHGGRPAAYFCPQSALRSIA